MFKKNKFKIEPHSITIYPNNRGLILTPFIAIVIVIFIISNNIFNNQPGNIFGNMSYCIYTVMALTPVITWIIGVSGIIFDAEQKAVFIKNVFVKKRLYYFDDIAGIMPVVNNYGEYYYKISEKKDVYSKGIRISAGYLSEDKSAAEFEQQVLPALQQMLENATSFAPKSNHAIIAFKFYINNDMIYRLKTGLNLFIWPIVTFSISIFSFVIILLDFSKHWKMSDYLALTTCFLLPFIISFFYTKKIIFDTTSKKIITYYIFNSFKRSHSFTDLVRFQITRKTYNFIYTGTTVSLLYNNGVESDLKLFYKTKSLQDFLIETETILKT